MGQKQGGHRKYLLLHASRSEFRSKALAGCYGLEQMKIELGAFCAAENILDRVPTSNLSNNSDICRRYVLLPFINGRETLTGFYNA